MTTQCTILVTCGAAAVVFAITQTGIPVGSPMVLQMAILQTRERWWKHWSIQLHLRRLKRTRNLHAEQANAGWVNAARQLPGCAKHDRDHGALSDQRVCGINSIGAADNAHLLY
jgi:hypothetical protein